MPNGPNLDAIVIQTLEQQVDLLTSQRDILTRVEHLLARLIEVQSPARSTADAGRMKGESFFSDSR